MVRYIKNNSMFSSNSKSCWWIFLWSRDMSIRPIDYAMIQRTSDVESIRRQEESKPIAEQQNIQVQVENREDKLRHQVLDPQNSNQTKNDADARDEGKGKYLRTSYQSYRRCI